MKTIIEDLYQIPRYLMGAGFDSALTYIDHLIPLEISEYASGTEVGTWTIPDEWIVRDAWVKFKGEKIIDWKKDPLSLVVGSLPFSGTVDRETLKTHLHFVDEQPDAHIYEYKFYERDWGFTMPKNKLWSFSDDLATGELIRTDLLEEGDYEVFIDTEYKPGVMKVGVHTIKGKTDKEILLFAHLDHPYQANDNLSGVACLIDLVRHIKPEQYEHTIKLVFCAETIGSTAYALGRKDLNKVDFVIALDCVGNKNEEGILFHRSFDKEHRVNDAVHLALRGTAEGFRQSQFRTSIGSDEYAFNDPNIGIPGIMLSTHPYPEYHTSLDTPAIIDYEVIEKVQKVLMKTIEYYESDYRPVKEFKGPLMRSKYRIQKPGKDFNMAWDYLIYEMDGTKYLSKLCCTYGLNYEYTKELLEGLIADYKVSRRVDDSKRGLKKASPKKSPTA
jgi:aminopeptidase-like protein